MSRKQTTEQGHEPGAATPGEKEPRLTCRTLHPAMSPPRSAAAGSRELEWVLLLTDSPGSGELTVRESRG